MARWSTGGWEWRRRRLIGAFVHGLVVPINGVEGLRHRERQQENSGDKRENCPGVPKVRMNQVRSPLVPTLPAILVHLPVHLVQATIRIKRHILGQMVEELRHRLVAPHGVLNDAFAV